MNAVLIQKKNSMTRILKQLIRGIGKKSNKLISDPMLLILLPQVLLKGVDEQTLKIAKKSLYNYP
jgi:hypothetical protein